VKLLIILKDVEKLKLLNLLLLILYPIAWVAPLLQGTAFMIFTATEVSILTGIEDIWRTDIFLAVVVIIFAIAAPYLKTIAVAFVHFGIAGRRVLRSAQFLSKLAMADLFLIAIYIAVYKGIANIEVRWGLYLFTACILASLFVSWRTEQSYDSMAD
tara:strand:- start:2339 stop:2809 length:471 start_codon:yes stop_codon:yes gene_type:complete